MNSNADYINLVGGEPAQTSKNEFVPFVLSDYIKNPIRLKRIENGLNQRQLAKLLGVTQGYVSRIESRNFTVTKELMGRITSVIGRKAGKRRK